MISIVRSLAKFDGRSSFATWVYRIATNASLDELRRRRRRPVRRCRAHRRRSHHDRARRSRCRRAHRRRSSTAWSLDQALADLRRGLPCARRAARRRRTSTTPRSPRCSAFRSARSRAASPAAGLRSPSASALQLSGTRPERRTSNTSARHRCDDQTTPTPSPTNPMTDEPLDPSDSSPALPSTTRSPPTSAPRSTRPPSSTEELAVLRGGARPARPMSRCRPRLARPAIAAALAAFDEAAGAPRQRTGQPRPSVVVDQPTPPHAVSMARRRRSGRGRGHRRHRRAHPATAATTTRRRPSRRAARTPTRASEAARPRGDQQATPPTPPPPSRTRRQVAPTPASGAAGRIRGVQPELTSIDSAAAVSPWIERSAPSTRPSSSTAVRRQPVVRHDGGSHVAATAASRRRHADHGQRRVSGSGRRRADGRCRPATRCNARRCQRPVGSTRRCRPHSWCTSVRTRSWSATTATSRSGGLRGGHVPTCSSPSTSADDARLCRGALGSTPMPGNPLTDPNWAAELADTIERTRRHRSSQDHPTTAAGLPRRDLRRRRRLRRHGRASCCSSSRCIRAAAGVPRASSSITTTRCGSRTSSSASIFTIVGLIVMKKRFPTRSGHGTSCEPITTSSSSAPARPA